MQFSDIILGMDSNYSEIFDIDYNSALKNLSDYPYKKEGNKLFSGEKGNDCKVKIDDGQFQITLHKHQAFTPYFKGKLISQNGKSEVEGKFLISSLSLSLAFIWVLIFLILTIKWVFSPMSVEDGQYLPFFLLIGILILIYHKYNGHKKIKSLRNFIKLLLQKNRD